MKSTNNTALAVVMASESYENQKESFKTLINEVNQLLEEKKITAFGKEYDIQVLIGGDYKVKHYQSDHIEYIKAQSVCNYNKIK